MGLKVPKPPAWWGDDLNGQISSNSDDSPPVTVTDPDFINRPVPDLGAGIKPTYTGPDPAYYAKLGETARQLMSGANDPEGFAAAGGLLYDATNLARFKAGHSLDAQSHGGSRAYGNYVFGVYNAARGAGLPDALDLANTYGKYFSQYDRQVMDKTYTSIPADNVQNITRGYHDYKNGTLQRGP